MLSYLYFLTCGSELLKELTALVNLIFYKPSQYWEKFESALPQLFVDFTVDLATQCKRRKSERTGSTGDRPVACSATRAHWTTEPIKCTSDLLLLTKTRNWPHILCVITAKKHCVTGQKWNVRAYLSEFPWPGWNQRTTQLTVIFIW